MANPIAWMYQDNFGTHFTEYKRDWYDAVGIESVTPLFTKKDARLEGLTDALLICQHYEKPNLYGERQACDAIQRLIDSIKEFS